MTTLDKFIDSIDKEYKRNKDFYDSQVVIDINTLITKSSVVKNLKKRING